LSLFTWELAIHDGVAAMVRWWSESRVKQALPWVAGLTLLVGLSLTRQHSYLLFHSLAEIFRVVVACATFLLFWNTRRFLDNGAFLYVGIAYLFVAVVDLLHTLAYNEMGIFVGHTANLPTQLWMAARFLECGGFLLAAWSVRRMPHAGMIVVVFAAMTLGLLASIFAYPLFPDCYVPDRGLTPFKKWAEYAVCGVFLASALLFWRERNRFDPRVFRPLMAALITTIAAELAFTVYVDVEGPANMTGHLLKIGSFFLIYRAMIEVSLRRPYDSIFRELNRSAEVIRESEMRFRTLADYTYDWEYWLGPDGRYLHVSPSCERITGYRAEEFLTSPSLVLQLVHADDRLLLEQHLEEGLQTREPQRIQFRIHDRQGNLHWIEQVSQPVFAPPNRFLGLRGSNRDVTQRVAIEEAMRDAQRRMMAQERAAKEVAEAELVKVKAQLVRQTRLAAIGQIAASIVHDVRNPLAAIKMATQLLVRKIAEPSARDLLQVIDNQITLTDRIISNLMEMAHSKESQRQSVDLGQLLEELRRELEPQYDLRWQIELECEPFLVAADAVQLRQVLANLVHNAAQATGGCGRIRIAARRADLFQQIEVEDDGQGVPGEIRDEIFEPLVTTKPKGTGLGLSICRQIVERHGGSIELCAATGTGTRFRILLPAESTPVAAGCSQ